MRPIRDRLTYPVLNPWSQDATALSLGVYLPELEVDADAC